MGQTGGTATGASGTSGTAGDMGVGGTTGGTERCTSGPYTVQFGEPQMLQAGANAQGVAVADVNMDGALDVVATSRDDQETWTYMGDGAGQLDNPFKFSLTGLAPSPTKLELGVIAGDGVIDIAYLAEGLSPRAVQRRRGIANDGMWGVPVTYVDNPTAFRMADINGDGRLDLVFTAQSTLFARLGDANEDFGAKGPILDLGVAVQDLALEDFDGDGDLDAVLGAFGEVRVALGDGQGSFTAGASLSLNGLVMGIGTGDLTGDGDTDIVAVTAGGNSDGASLFPGKGDGTFDVLVPVTVQDEPNGIVVRDFDRDGIDDLAVSHTNGTFVVRLSKGGGSFGNSLVKTCGNNLQSIVAADLNGDCVPEILATSPTEDKICILWSE